MGRYKYLPHILVWNVFFGVVCLPTAGKLIDIGGVPQSVAILYFPFIYIFGDIMTEVYGYAVARRILWYNIAAQVAATLIFVMVVAWPPATAMTNNQSFIDVLSSAPRFVLFGNLAVFIGDIVNNYVLAKMKVWTEGRWMPLRFIASTLCGQFVNTAFFYCFGMWGLLPVHSLLASIVVASLTKVAIETVLLPVTLRVSRWLKQAEGVDFYDRDTDFNPLKF